MRRRQRDELERFKQPIRMRNGRLVGTRHTAVSQRLVNMIAERLSTSALRRSKGKGERRRAARRRASRLPQAPKITSLLKGSAHGLFVRSLCFCHSPRRISQHLMAHRSCFFLCTSTWTLWKRGQSALHTFTYSGCTSYQT